MTRSALLVSLILLATAAWSQDAAALCETLKSTIEAEDLRYLRALKAPSEERIKPIHPYAEPIDGLPGHASTVGSLCYALQQVRQQMVNPLSPDARIVKACVGLYSAIVSPNRPIPLSLNLVALCPERAN
jgi:hypothetical protein